LVNDWKKTGRDFFWRQNSCFMLNNVLEGCLLLLVLEGCLLKCAMIIRENHPTLFGHKMKMKKQKGFSLIELLVVIAIIGVLSGILLIALGSTRAKARDAKRKQEINQIGRFFTANNCFVPSAGAGEYDLAQLYAEVRSSYPQISQIASLPKDPKSGSETQTNYRYQVTADNHCILYANLENENEAITLQGLDRPTAGRGSGTLRASSTGINGTAIYFQAGR
jgi:prepilin-type N-terminal cleavage/methylation domain-containing protein